MVMFSISTTIFLLAILSAFTTGTIFRKPECGKLHAAWTKIYFGQKLIESIHSLVKGITSKECEIKCMLYPKCKSISVKENESLCMLHRSRHGENGTRLDLVNGWTHIETDDQLKNFGPHCAAQKPCKHGRCIDTCDGEQYQCQCDGENWRLQATDVCFGARDGRYGQFQLKNKGKLLKLKFVQVGYYSLSCANNITVSKWGCSVRSNSIFMIITFSNNTVFLPKWSNVVLPSEGRYFYNVPDYNGNSPFIVLDGYNTSLTGGEDFRIWYEEDLYNLAENDNSGTSCADIYAVFCD